MEYDLFHFEHQVPGGMISNLTRQLCEVGMEDRIQEILKEVIQVRKELGYPVMATPFSQIVGVQAMENIVSGKRYDRIPDEVIKYVMGLYGTPDGPVDSEVMERISQLPQAEEFKSWKPEGYFKSIEELRSEIGPDLDDDDLLLTILIPGYKKENLSRKPPVVGASVADPITTVNSPVDFPAKFYVDVDGEQYNVKVSPVWGNGDGDSGIESDQPNQSDVSAKSMTTAEIPAGAMVSGMAGLVLSIDVQVGDQINKGDQVAVIEAMKMMRNYIAPHGGTVKKICVRTNDMVETEDIIMVVE
jgi:pyruvate carboxylase